MAEGRAAIFLDRDGVINRERPDYVRRWEEFEFLPGALAALARLAALPLPLIVITNQSAIGRGLVTMAQVQAIHARMVAHVEAAGGRISEVFCCPHHPDDGCACRKPRPALLQQAARRYALSLPRCHFVGDAYSDFLAARAAGCQPVLVRSGRQGSGLAAQPGVGGVPLFADLPDAAHWLCQQHAAPTRRPNSSLRSLT